MANYIKVSAAGTDAERSTCGFRQRLLKRDDGAPASITVLTTDNARPHYHKVTHEYYYIMEGTGVLHIDGEVVPVEAGDCVWIKPPAMHHAEGELKSIIVGVPPFSEEDLFFS